MIWLTWRQLRAQAAVVLGAAAAFALVLAVTGPGLADLRKTSGSSFLELVAVERADRSLYFTGVVVLILLPAVIGAFWGAPLIARELETGTHRLAWSQGVTRNRWLLVKIGLTGLAAIAATGLLSLAVTWWSDPVDSAINSGSNGFGAARLTPVMFDARGVVPLGYAAFAFAAGVTAGAVIRRTVPAMAVTLVVFAAVQLAVPQWVRPHLIPPTTATIAITADNMHGLQRTGGPNGPIRVMVDSTEPGSWLLSSYTVDSAGQRVLDLPTWVSDCMVPPGKSASGTSQQACFDRLAQAGYQQQLTYQPASRFWALQWLETAVYLALALALSGFTFWWLRR